MDNTQLQEAAKGLGLQTQDEKLDHCIEVFDQMRAYTGGILEGPQLSFIRTRVDSELQRIQNFLNGIGGTRNNTGISAIAGTNHQDMGPVTEILGQKIEVRKPITTNDVVVTVDEKAEFMRKRQDLLDRLDTATDDELLDGLQLPGNETLMRSAAKKLGLDDYREAAIDVDLLQRLRLAKAAEITRRQAMSDADLAAERLKQSNEDDEETEVVLGQKIEDNTPPITPPAATTEDSTDPKGKGKAKK